MSVAVIGLGSNLSHPRRQIARALSSLARLPRTRVLAWSRNFRTEPIGTSEPQPDYVNAVAIVDTSLTPRALLGRLFEIERRQRRRRVANGPRNAARTLDLDLLLFSSRRQDTPGLTLPHPRMHRRAFVLVPLVEIAPHVAIPGRGLARRALRNVRDQRVVPTRTHVLA